MSHKNIENTALWSMINAFDKIGFTVFEIHPNLYLDITNIEIQCHKILLHTKVINDFSNYLIRNVYNLSSVQNEIIFMLLIYEH